MGYMLYTVYGVLAENKLKKLLSKANVEFDKSKPTEVWKVIKAFSHSSIKFFL